MTNFGSMRGPLILPIYDVTRPIKIWIPNMNKKNSDPNTGTFLLASVP